MVFSRYLVKLVVLSHFGSVAAVALDFIQGDVAISAASSSENATNLSAPAAAAAAAPAAPAAQAAAAASSGWTLLGCYTDSVSARSLPYAAGVPGGPTAMTNELCQSTCLAAGYSLAGTEYSDECCESQFLV
jgi:hypothetical protein